MKIDKGKVYFARTPYGEEEVNAVEQCLRSGWLGPAEYTNEFEKGVAKLFDKEYGIMVNSGSSALLLAARLLDIKPGDEIVTGATGFPTTINPFIQMGASVVLVDTIPETLSPSLEQLEDAITENTKAIVVAHIFGSTLDMPKLRDIADKHEVVLVEDSCDSLGATINGVSTGKWSDISVTSFYASHIITACGGGGMICVNGSENNSRVRLFRDWGRYENTEDVGRRFSADASGVPYDAKFVYDEIGYNLKATEVQAAFGLVQLGKLDGFNVDRRKNYSKLCNIVSKYGITPVSATPGSEPSWLTFPMLCANAQERESLALHLERNNIQTRPILAGNFMIHNAYKGKDVRPHGQLTGSEHITRVGIGIGLHSEITDETLDYIDSTIGTFYG